MRYFWMIVLLVSTIQSKAQHTLSGTLYDGSSSTGLGYATVSLLDLSQGKIRDGALTDSSGHFILNDVPQGRYLVKADFLGYKQAVSDTIRISGTQGNTTLPAMTLMADGHNLDMVTVSARAAVIENKVDRLIYNAAADVTAQGGVALDVLKKVPQVSVDADGNVELQGNPNIRFLINGKPSGMFGSSLTDALASIPASGIQSIEVITNPGAQYDAQGTGGIINIKLKENRRAGSNGSIDLSAGTRLENGSANLNYRKNNIGFNAFISGNAQINSRSPASQDRTGYDASAQQYTRLQQEGYTDMIRKGLQTGLGMDWTLSRDNVLTATLQYSDFSMRKTGETQQLETTLNDAGQALSDQPATRSTLSSFRSRAVDWSLGYKSKLGGKDDELNLLYTASLGNPEMHSRQSLSMPGATQPYAGNDVINPGKDQQHYLSIDYSHPFSDGLKLEAGLKGSLQHIESDNRQSLLSAGPEQYVFSPGLSYLLRYDLSVYAGYVSASAKLWHWLDLKAGLRLEYTHIRLNGDKNLIPSYTTPVPTLLLSHEFAGRQLIRLSFSRRLERPEYEELNPFLNLSDPYNIVTGNPYLRPEIANNFELGYSRSFDNGVNIFAALTERINTSDVKSFTTFYPVYTVGDSAYYNVSVTDKRNIGKEYNSGLTLSGSVPIGALNLRTNAMFIHKHIVNELPGASAVTNAFTTRINLNASYTLPAGFLAEASGNYRSGFVSIQGRQPQLLTYTFAVRKQFRNSRASVGLTATNIFSRYVRQTTTVQTDNYTSYAVRDLPFRSIGITFGYKFGKTETGKKEKLPVTTEHLPSEN
ncbi:outer membrane beta-barrel protein [Taibaiella koreensis]|uniref:outer membrane beta-barrel protein n=1 Tax=Taibaiella koreensis TaxID=1268548 RepID=UPI000E59EE50|nr:outer membrane beta-barrel protein [Taibaiella koreensis]